MIKVVGYTRKSPDEKEKTDVSLKNQEDLIEKLCEEKEWELEQIYSDKNISGSDRQRKGFLEMLNYVKTKKHIEIVVVKDQDRFARDSSFFSDTLTDLDAYGIKVFSILKNKFLSHEDLGDMVTSLVDAHFIVSQKKKAKALYEQKKEKGLPSFVPPFGYKKKSNWSSKSMRGTGKWILFPKQAEIVRDVCKSFLNGENFKITLNRLKINKSLYYRIIKTARNGVYNGWIFYIHKITDSQKKIVRTEEIKYQGQHDLILDNGIYEALRKVIKE